MTLNDIVGKIAKHNWKKYLLFCFCITFAVSMVGAFGIILFSSTVTDILSTLGSTYMTALALYGATVVGLLIFALYANSIYVKYKMDEVGVFLSLGLKPSDVRKLMNKEFCGLYGLSAVFGVLLALPVSYLSWSFLTTFLTTAETGFRIGWAGYGVALIYVLIVAGTLLLKNSTTISKIDIIQILKVTATNETVKGASFLPGLIGLVCVPAGIAAFWILNSSGNLSDSYSSFAGFGLVLSAVGLYFFIAYITSVGSFFQRFHNPYYLKNLLFFNLLKQKGKQYTLSLFISTLLIAISIFGICFNCAGFVLGYNQIANDTFDYALLVPYIHADAINTKALQNIAAQNDAAFATINELQLLHVGRQHMYGKDFSEWSEEFCVNVTDFNALAGTDLSVEPGYFVFFSSLEQSSSFQTLSQNGNMFYHPTSEDFFQLDLQDTFSSGSIMNTSGAIKGLVILNDNDFNTFSDKLDAKYKYAYYLWDAVRFGNSAGFFEELLDTVVHANGRQYMVNFNTLPVRELMRQDGKDIPLEDIFRPFDGNELDAARNWELYPFSRAGSTSAMIEAGAVYLLLMFFIAMIGFVSATMIIGLRVVSTIWQDEAAYRKAEILGMKPVGLKRLVTQQMALIFFFPTIIGALLSVMIINRIVDVTSASQYSGLITLIAVVLSLAAIFVEVCVFFILRKKVLKDTCRVNY